MFTGTGSSTTSSDRLKGWKEIGEFLHACDRTAQRWERQLQLPVHRVPTARSAVVFGSKSEIEKWLLTKEGRTAVAEGGGALPGVADLPLLEEGHEGTASVAAAGGDAAVSDEAVAGVEVAEQTVVSSNVIRKQRSFAVFEWHFLLGAILMTAAVAAAVTVRTRLPEPRSSASTAPRIVRHDRIDKPSEPVPTLRLGFANGASARVACPEGTATSIGVSGTETVALSVTVVNRTLLAHLYRISRSQNPGDQRLEEVAVFSLREREKIDVPSGGTLRTAEWLK